MPTRTPPHDGVFARIGPSRIHGVGAIAIRDIPARTLVFRGEDERAVWVARSAVRKLPKAIRARGWQTSSRGWMKARCWPNSMGWPPDSTARCRWWK